MNDNNEMDCVLEEQLLPNIKCSEEDKELKDEPRLEDNSDINLKTETHADPLQETASGSTKFTWLFKDEDILLKDEQLAEMVLKPGRARGKRGRPSSTSSFSSSNGYTWDLDGPAQEELVLPRQQACGKGPAKSVSNAVESWMLLFDDEMLRILLLIMNEQIRERRTNTYTERPTDLTELRSWLGLSYLCGVFRNAQHNGPLEELWTLELGNAIFRATMSFSRFQFLAECLDSQHDSTWNEAQRLWKKLLINCRSYYGPSGWLAVNELPVLDNAHFALCCDTKTLYMTNGLLSKQSMMPSKELMQLICDYKTTGRNITLGERYANVRNCELLLQNNLSSICTLLPTAPEYPKNWRAGTLFNGAKRLTHTQSGAACLTCGLSPQVNALETQLRTLKVCGQTHELFARYSTGFSVAVTKSDHFLQHLHLILNIAAFNAWILLRLSPKGDSGMEQRDFQRQLGLFLTQQRLQRRLHRRSTTTTLVMRLQICEILGQSSQRLLSEAFSDAKQSHGVGVIRLSRAMLPEGATLVSRYGDKHRRCKPCARNKRETKARSRCQQCQAHRCGNHLISRCYDCMGLTSSQLPDGNIKDT